MQIGTNFYLNKCDVRTFLLYTYNSPIYTNNYDDNNTVYTNMVASFKFNKIKTSYKYT